MKHIDPHCHCRDGWESYKMTIRRASELAREQGLGAICDMPNTSPPILHEKDVIRRLALAKKRNPVVKYFLYVGLTSDEKQIREAGKIVQKYPEVVGLKLYCSKSTIFGVPREKDQRKVYRILAKQGYTGVLAVHCEKEELWHSLVQLEEVEIESLEDQIIFAMEEKFPGTLYICHISLPESANLIWQAKKYLSIFSEVTPHHLLLSWEDSKKLVNPPLRDRKTVKELLMAVKDGVIDCIGTDFAPGRRYSIASYELYGQALDFLRKQGVTEERIDELTYWNIKRAFGNKLKEV